MLGRQLVSNVDKLLRGQIATREQLQDGQIEVPSRSLVVACLVLGAFYGAMMGLYGATNRGAEGWSQMLASTIKVPLLFLLTLLVTFPSLYVFSALARSRLNLVATSRLLLAAITVNLVVLASFGPVTAFFTLSTTSHPFMVLLNVAFFGIAGIVGLAFVKKALSHAFQDEEPDTASAPAPEGATHSYRRHTTSRGVAHNVFAVWLVIFAVVGAQMGWILRPFVGTPELPFEWFRERHSNFFAAVIDLIAKLFR